MDWEERLAKGYVTGRQVLEHNGVVPHEPTKPKTKPKKTKKKPPKKKKK